MSTPETPKKAPQFSAFKLSPVPAKDDCCCDGACETQNAQPLPESGNHYSWVVDGMDCAACARKVENAVKQIPGVSHVQVRFATEKLLVSAESDVSEQVVSAVSQAGYSLRSETAPAEKTAPLRENLPLIALVMMMALSWGLEQINQPFGNLAFIATTLVGLYPIARQALRLMKSGSWFAIETLMSVAAIGALFIGATAEAAMVLLLFLIGERLEGWAASRARKGVSALMALKPETATRVAGNERQTVAINALRPGDVIEVAAGGRLPADGTLLTATASFDESALTGESIPVERTAGEKVPAGATSVDRLVQLTVLSEPGDSAIDRILKLIEEAEERRAPVERFIDRFSRIYTPAIMLVALLVTIVPPLFFGAPWEGWIYKGLTLLLIGCPCALVISTPAAITSGLAAAARRGALIKGGAALEQLSQVQQVAFDKTGTLTVGKPQVTGVYPQDIGEDELLTLAAAVEQGSTHPLAQAIVREAQSRGLAIPAATAQRALVGSGIEADIDGKKVLIVAAGKSSNSEVEALEQTGQTVVTVMQDGIAKGMLALRDTLRDDAKEAVAALHQLGVQGVILTGDNPRAAAAIAGELGLDFKAGLLPADKVSAVTELNSHAPLAMIGDGINDAPAMKASTIGIAMGSGTDVALETADAALTHNRLTGLAQMISLARATRANIRQNISIALGLKGIFLVTTLLGITGLWLAVLADTGATVLVTANALRLLRRK
ncbi:Zn(II)/Cd(II)/Pb(II) translocating P-type ATPase ZntA [Enterobacter cloacae]|uniref:P-type Zn(2+) transporter n=1 Tax=Enterobacter cloacae subsp. cloacae (strain ATCC 13047 / DSM 30054 / NBRC 13535 / NCTC 10005 / WDCM 00083 / NCDC 279-56) TaxID=716541 RepID=A0A0H3CSX2_ENTCC|nr:Zn(II)/Cd(II)/Pb(II) translocating P-type ATPase ZntA [Enterobacter cloacae]MBP7742667.1 Zn(II)/Cd(II)/Pb(II) translocating P-type ATPase ZntA [Enterobacter sp.]ADF64358.1 zinc/cadmium/mercury/lead-transporting ATPase [Enterobacter cloacae subsp. cloacae ATCC 13047]KGB07967.1 cadmium-translocating P-type ATPase [Enterobacter cloacae]MCJ8536366.1 Zn(II)/Cd(II)/Pb(II) translocating P-type ATPase ZntA [Enterobacter cloacae]MCK6884030.1 Zn(II)/Cd(II)/Pb(II) translocating P-type ATPase ZntA [Ent